MKKIIAILSALAALLTPGCKENINPADMHGSFNCIINEEILIKPAPEQTEGTCAKLYAYISNTANGSTVMNRVKKLNKNHYHNACAYTVSEALRGIGVKIPKYVKQTRQLERELAARGFKRSYDISNMKPGAIAFTTPSNTRTKYPSHVYIFMGWSSPGVARIFDNQIYDYGSFYHSRPIKFHYFKGNKRKTREATTYYMYK